MICFEQNALNFTFLQATALRSQPAAISLQTLLLLEYRPFLTALSSTLVKLGILNPVFKLSSRPPRHRSVLKGLSLPEGYHLGIGFTVTLFLMLTSVVFVAVRSLNSQQVS